MAKQINTVIACMLTSLFLNSALAAEAENAEINNPEVSSEADTEEPVLNQAEAGTADELNTEEPEGDDDFIPSSQISEDLSVSFPVDI
tara:strand:+ start:424 stop:687 length:264 start_codon:yes stop_codon:yes gene_type:complete